MSYVPHRVLCILQYYIVAAIAQAQEQSFSCDVRPCFLCSLIVDPSIFKGVLWVR